MPSMRFLVTGGAGFIGSNVALALQEKKLGEVVVLDNFSSADFHNLEGFKGDVVTADVEKTDWIEKVGRVDAILHQAALTDTTVTDPRRQMEANVEGLRMVLQFAEETGVRRVVYASSAGVYGNGSCPMREEQGATPHNAYGFSKAIADELARDTAREHPHLTLVGLRYFNVYGPREAHKGTARSMILQLAQQMKAGKKPRLFKFGDQARDWVYVKDVVEANLKALQAKQSCTVNVGTGRAVSYNRLVEVLNEVLGTDLQPDYIDNPYAGYQDKTQAAVEAAERLLGFKAAYDVEAGIRDYIGGSKVPVGA